MLQVFESLSKTCNMLPQRDVALKVAQCAMLHDIDFERNNVALKIGSCLQHHLKVEKHEVMR